MLTAYQEELLSYLTGRAPVGTAFEFRPHEIAADLRWHLSRVHSRLARLLDVKVVERVSRGNRGRYGVLRVLRRLELA